MARRVFGPWLGSVAGIRPKALIAAGRADDDRECRAEAPATYPQKERTFHSAADFARVTGGKLRVERTADRGAARRALRRAIPSWPVADVTVLGPDSGSALWVGTSAGRSATATAIAATNTSPASAGCPTISVTGIGFDGDSRVARDAERLFAHRLSDDDARGEVAGIRAAHAGAAPALGPHRRFHLARRRRSLDQSTACRRTTTACGPRCTWRPRASASR